MPLNSVGKLWAQIFIVILVLKGACIGDYTAEYRKISIRALGLINEVKFAGGREAIGDRTSFFDKYSFQFFKKL
ncbi:hypothetical protein VCR4J5_200466 [Vibrio crassostreae]|uniref:Uncharacterized protein n=1 Tax=Vibrio crassostreae TaxID=246167 RepID=A0ABM9QUX0_9VIBR|nr:hypothetical protein VCR19J5_220064 [Vibrio crassostreae]CDT36886.1 hypothetical protein VCR4J5_200466 [Vibrio crassostreae]